MRFVIQNNADISNKYIRFTKWRLWKLKKKFDHLQYADILISKEGQHRAKYKVILRLGVPGKDLVLKFKQNNLNTLLSEVLDKAGRALSQLKNKNLERSIQYAISINNQ